MDSDPKLTSHESIPAHHRLPRRGIAMVTAIFALVVVGILVAGMFNLATLRAKTVKNRTASARALLLAESAAAHAVMLARDTLHKKANSALLRGSDNLINTADDGRLVDFGMSSGVQIPSTGYATTEGRYWVQFIDDQAETDGDPFRDSNTRIIARCRAATPDSGYASIDVLITGISQMPGFFANGNFALGGNNSLVGQCGSVHANGNLTVGNPGPRLSGEATASGTVTNGTAVKLPDGSSNPAVPNQVPLDVPPLPYSDFCPSKAAYVLRSDGKIEDRTTVPSVLRGIGWAPNVTMTTSGAATIWTATASGLSLIPGTLCVQGNFDLQGNVGSALAAHPIMVVATQSIKVSGNPYLRPATTDSILFVAGADISVAGNPASGAVSYQGLLYAGSQCVVSGSAVIQGNVVCRDAPHTTAAVDHATGSSISGSATVNYGCGGYFNQPRRILQWVQRVL